MSEYWKSTPKYWCKHCSTYVRDTKLDRANHEATGRHKGAVERALRDLHRGHEKQEREKERARREIERLNGVVSGGAASSSGAKKSTDTPATPAPPPPTLQQLSREERQAQLQQLVDMGVNIPEEFRREMAMAGEWTITNTRVIDDEEGGSGGAEGRAMGVRKRELEKTEEEKEEEDAVKGLFKKQRRWGRDTRTVAEAKDEEDEDLDALLSGSFVKRKEAEKEDGVGVKTEVKHEVKREEGVDTQDAGPGAPGEGVKEAVKAAPVVKKEPGDEGDTGVRAAAADRDDEWPDGAGSWGAAPAVVFKKRKPKNVRQR